MPRSAIRAHERYLLFSVYCPFSMGARVLGTRHGLQWAAHAREGLANPQ